MFGHRSRGRHADVIPVDIRRRLEEIDRWRTAIEEEIAGYRAEVTLAREAVCDAFTAAGVDPPPSCRFRVVSHSDTSAARA